MSKKILIDSLFPHKTNPNMKLKVNKRLYAEARKSKTKKGYARGGSMKKKGYAMGGVAKKYGVVDSAFRLRPCWTDMIQRGGYSGWDK